MSRGFWGDVGRGPGDGRGGVVVRPRPLTVPLADVSAVNQDGEHCSLKEDDEGPGRLGEVRSPPRHSGVVGAGVPKPAGAGRSLMESAL